MGMTDKELLELAAKAAGIRVKIWDGYTGPMCAIDDERHGRMWMPLADDGDALRLAVQLNFDIFQDPVSAKCNAVEVIANEPEDGECKFWANESRAPDPYAATRRAIVRAAAEIGKAIP